MTESPAEDMSSLFGGARGTSLKDLTARLRKAAKDPAVKAVRSDKDEWAKLSAVRDWPATTWFAGKARLSVNVYPQQFRNSAAVAEAGL